MTIDLRGCVPDGEIEAGSGLGRGSPVKMPRSWGGAGAWPRTLAWTATGAPSPSCLGEWSARSQFCPVWHLVGGLSCPVCTLSRATQAGGVRGLGSVCTRGSGQVLHSSLLMEPSSSCLGAEVSLAGKTQQGPGKVPIRQQGGAGSSPCCDQLSAYSS